MVAKITPTLVASCLLILLSCLATTPSKAQTVNRGISSVRGYRQDLLLADNGALASVELRLPILRIPQGDGVMQVTPFVDVGTAWNNSSSIDENNINTNTLASVGLGLRWLQGNNFNAGVEWGIPLVSIDTQGNTWQENGLYFFVQYNPF